MCSILGTNLLAMFSVGLEEIPVASPQSDHAILSHLRSSELRLQQVAESREEAQLCSKPTNVDFGKILRDSGAILMRTSRLQHFESAFPIGGHGRAIASPHGRGPRGTT